MTYDHFTANNCTCPMCGDNPNITCTCLHTNYTGHISGYLVSVEGSSEEGKIPIKVKKKRMSRMQKNYLYGR